MKRALPLINEARNPPTVGPLFVSGSTLAPRLGPSGTRIGGEGQGEYGGKDSTRWPATTALMDLASQGAWRVMATIVIKSPVAATSPSANMFVRPAGRSQAWVRGPWTDA